MHTHPKSLLLAPSHKAYALIDSGDGMKLERFGSKVIARPSSLSMWRRLKSHNDWRRADARYEPDKGWHFSAKTFEEWDLDFDLQIRLRLQNNGQLGIFPEHLWYMAELQRIVQKLVKQKKIARVLNLFAYTGMATLFCASAGATVTHVDLSKRALDWARTNLELNRLTGGKIRLIPEDAERFIAREIKRDNNYDLVIIDPPSFSRVSSKKSWKLDDVVTGLLEGCRKLLAADGVFCFTSHSFEYGDIILANVVRDFFPSSKEILNTPLLIQELGSDRQLPSGSLVMAYL